MDAKEFQTWLTGAELQIAAARRAIQIGNFGDAIQYAKNAEVDLYMVTREAERPSGERETVVEECIRLADEATKRNS